MKKKIINVVVIIGFAVSVGLNLYYFGWKALERKAQRDMQRGANAAVSQVIQEAQKGRVVINTPTGQLVLVPIQTDPNL